MSKNADNPMVFWITGLSGAGKTTFARCFKHELDLSGLSSVILDGDDVRSIIGDDACGYDHESRLKNAYRICRFTRMLVEQGIIVIVATISLYHEVHAWNRENIPGYIEILIETDEATRYKRDPKGLYKRVADGAKVCMAGVDLDVEFPENPHYHIENDGDLESLKAFCSQLLETHCANKEKMFEVS